MDGLAVETVSTTRDEPRGMTVADLLVLVAGCAGFLVLPWFGFQPGEVAWLRAGADWEGFYTVTGTLGEGAERLALVLTLVVIARRIRYGGVARPGEYLLGYVALHLLLTPRAGMLKVPGAATPAGRCAILAVLMLSACALVIGHRRLPGWTKTLLLLVASLAYSILEQGIDDLVTWIGPAMNWYVVANFCFFPGLFLLTIPFAAAVLGDGRDRRGRSWLEWCGIGLAIAWFSLREAHHFASAMLSDPVEEFVMMVLLGLGLWFVAAAISIRLIRRFGPAWTRWIEPGEPCPAENGGREDVSRRGPIGTV